MPANSSIQTMLAIIMKCAICFVITFCFLNSCVLSGDLPTSKVSEKTTPTKLAAILTQQRKLTCRTGQYALADDRGGIYCLPCPENHYMDEDNHVHSECKVCTPVEDHIHYKVLKRNCTPDSDTIFACADNYFMGPNSDCKVCTQCQHEHGKPYEASPCTQDNDRRCCDQPGMRVEWSSDGHSYKCVSESTTPEKQLPPNCVGSTLRTGGCMAGEYLAPECQYQADWLMCKPCAKGTFQNVSHHNLTSCTLCSLPEESNYQKMSHCNSTHDNVYKTVSMSPSNKILLIILITVLPVLGIVLVVMCMLWRCRDKKNCRKLFLGISSRQYNICNGKEYIYNCKDSDTHS